MEYKAVIFDLDGTLVHTMPEYRYTIVGNALKSIGIKTTSHLIDRFWFESRRDEIIKEHFGIEPGIFWKNYREREDPEIRR